MPVLASVLYGVWDVREELKAFAVCLFVVCQTQYHMRPVLTKSHGQELHESRAGLDGEARKQVSGWVEGVQLFTFLESEEVA